MRLDREIRGYPLDASGEVVPCARIAGSNTHLLERGPLVVSIHGYLHSMSFQSNGFDGLTIHAPDANGNAPPQRTAGVDQDHVALAVDSKTTDYIVASQAYAGDNCWYVVRDGQRSATSSHCDPDLAAIHALATNYRDELIVAGTEAGTGRGRIDVFDRPGSLAPQLVRSIVGRNTRLASIGPQLDYFNVSFSLATDPVSGAVYVYEDVSDVFSGNPTSGSDEPKILEFAADADGDAAPSRVIGGPHVGLMKYVLGLTILGVDDRMNLYAILRGRSLLVSVFGPQAHDDATPERRFSDASALVGDFGASLAVRSSIRSVSHGP